MCFEDAFWRSSSRKPCDMFGACQPRQVTVPGTSYIYWDLFPAMGKPTLLAISAGKGAEVGCFVQQAGARIWRFDGLMDRPGGLVFPLCSFKPVSHAFRLLVSLPISLMLRQNQEVIDDETAIRNAKEPLWHIFRSKAEPLYAVCMAGGPYAAT